MTIKGEKDASVYLAQIQSVFACFYLNMHNAKTKSEKSKILTESVKSLSSFKKKLEKCNGL